MRKRIPSLICACIVAAAAIFFHRYYFPARDGMIYACGVIAGQDGLSNTSREAVYCVPWRERAESVGFTPFGRHEMEAAK